MGRVEVKRDGEWGTVSDEGFGLSEANVACRAAGFGTAVAVQTGSHYGRGIGQVHHRNLRYVPSITTENVHTVTVHVCIYLLYTCI